MRWVICHADIDIGVLASEFSKCNYFPIKSVQNSALSPHPNTCKKSENIKKSEGKTLLQGGRALAQAAQRGGVFCSGEIPNPSGRDPVQPAPGDPALAGVVG